MWKKRGARRRLFLFRSAVSSAVVTRRVAAGRRPLNAGRSTNERGRDVAPRPLGVRATAFRRDGVMKKKKMSVRAHIPDFYVRANAVMFPVRICVKMSRIR